MTDQEHARAIAEQARRSFSEATTPERYQLTELALASDIARALSLTADTARAQAFEEAVTVIEQRIQQEKQRLEQAYKLPYNLRAIDARNAVTDALTAAAVELRARATPGDTP